MQTANELLYGMLGILKNIENKLASKEKETSSKQTGVKEIVNVASALSSFSRIKPKTTARFLDFMKELSEISKKSKGGKDFKSLSEGLINISVALPALASGMDDLGKIKTRQVDSALNSLHKLYDLMYELGDGRKSKKVEKSIKLFDSIGKSLTNVAKPLKMFSTFLMYLGLSFVIFAIGIVAASALLKLGSPMGIIGALLLVFGTLSLLIGIVYFTKKYVKESIGIIQEMGSAFKSIGESLLIFATSLVGLSLYMGTGNGFKGIGKAMLVMGGVILLVVGMFALLGFADKFVKKGVAVIKNIGTGFLFLTLGILGFVLGLLGLAAYMGAGESFKGIGKAMLVMTGVVLLVVGMFALLGYAQKFVKKGTSVVKGMGIGLFILIGGIFLFTLGLIGTAALLGLSSDPKGIALALGAMALTVGALVGIFYILGKAKKEVAIGTLVAILVTVGIMAIGFGVRYLAEQAKAITDMGKESEISDKGPFGKMMSSIGPGLGVIGGIFIAAAGLFAILGIPAVAAFVALGAGVAILIAGSLIVLGYAVGKLAQVASALKPEFPKQLGFMIGSVFEGMLSGMSVLTGGKTGVSGFIEFAKNSAKIFAVTGILMAVSVALSMFAYALSAFAELENMRVIAGTDKDGKPIFGDKINVTQVGQNISSSIATFLTSIIASTETLTKDQAGAIAKMARALTGRRGILTAVIQFADVLKTFAEFGPNGEIGFIDLVPDGKDEDGNPKFKQVQSKVKITDVVNNIVDSFSQFVKGIVSHSDDFEAAGKHGKAMMELSSALVGTDAFKAFGLSFGRKKPGLLVGISKFSEVLGIYAKYGASMKIPVLDSEGKETGPPVAVTTIADNIIKSLVAFITAIAGGNVDMEDKLKKAEANLSKFDNIIEKLHKIGESTDGLSRFSMTIGELANNIGLLTNNLEKLNVDKLGQVSNTSAAYLEKTNDYSVANERIMTGSKSTTAAPASSAPASSSKTESRGSGKSASSQQYKEPDWDVIAAQIGNAVGSQITSAMKAGHIKFEFSGSGGNKGVMEFD